MIFTRENRPIPINPGRKPVVLARANKYLFPEIPRRFDAESAQAKMIEILVDGGSCDCPLCGRQATAYVRKLRPNMVARLIVLLGRFIATEGGGKRPPAEPEVHIGNHNDFRMLRYWGLIEVVKHKGKTATVKPKIKTYSFVRGSESVPSHVFIYNGERFGESDRKINVKQALEGQYCYEELMRKVPIALSDIMIKMDMDIYTGKKNG